MSALDITIIQATPIPSPLPVLEPHDAEKTLDTEEARKARYRAELIDRQKDSGQKLSDFLLKLRDELRITDVDTRRKYLQDVDMMCRYVDVLQIGARNSQNFDLLKEVGQVDKPVILKRGPANSIEEWLMSAEYVLARGNENVAAIDPDDD
jgi:hypothetical protein